MAPPEAAFWDADFNPFIKKQNSGRTFGPPSFCPRDSDREICFRKGALA